MNLSLYKVYKRENFFRDSSPRKRPRRQIKTCAVCERSILFKTLCSNCFKKYCPEGVYPVWLQELVSMHYSFESKKASEELPFTDVRLNPHGERDFEVV